jgi:hypothetical protein
MLVDLCAKARCSSKMPVTHLVSEAVRGFSKLLTSLALIETTIRALNESVSSVPSTIKVRVKRLHLSIQALESNCLAARSWSVLQVSLK